MSYNILLPSTIIEVFGGSLGRQRLVEAIGERVAVDAGDCIPGLYRFGRIKGGESLGEETGQKQTGNIKVGLDSRQDTQPIKPQNMPDRTLYQSIHHRIGGSTCS